MRCPAPNLIAHDCVSAVDYPGFGGDCSVDPASELIRVGAAQVLPVGLSVERIEFDVGERQSTSELTGERRLTRACRADDGDPQPDPSSAIPTLAPRASGEGYSTASGDRR